MSGNIILDKQWDIYLADYKEMVDELIKSGDFNLENFRVCLQNLFFSAAEKKGSMLRKAGDDETQKANIEAFCSLARYIYKSVSGDNFYELCMDFGNPDSKHSDVEISKALSSKELAPLVAQIRAIFDPRSAQNNDPNFSPIHRCLELEETNLKGRVIAQLNEAPILRSESIKLLIFLTNMRRRGLGKGAFNCKVANITKVADCLKENIDDQPSGTRFQMMVFNTGHYTAVECRKVGGKKQAIVMDAAQDHRYGELCDTLKKQGYEVVAIGQPDKQERIQYDSVNCSFFSYDNLVNSSRIPDFFEQVLQLPSQIADDRRYVPWKEMPACILRNAQSNTFLSEAYVGKPTLAGESLHSDESDDDAKQTILRRYTDIHSIQTEASSDGAIPGKKKQTGIQNFRERQKSRAVASLELLSDQDLIDMLQKQKEIDPNLISNINDFQAHFFKFGDVLKELTDRVNKAALSPDGNSSASNILSVIRDNSMVMKKIQARAEKLSQSLDLAVKQLDPDNNKGRRKSY